MDDDVVYTNCEDIMPHGQHDMGDEGTIICIGKQYGPPPVRADYWPGD